MNVCLAGSIGDNMIETLNANGAGITKTVLDYQEALNAVSSGEFDKFVIVATGDLVWSHKFDEMDNLISNRNGKTKIFGFLASSFVFESEDQVWVELYTGKAVSRPALLDACITPNPLIIEEEPIVIAVQEESEILLGELGQESLNDRLLDRDEVYVLGITGQYDSSVLTSVLANLSLALSDLNREVQVISPIKEEILMTLPNVKKIGGIYHYNSLYWSTDIASRRYYAPLVLVNLESESSTQEKLDGVLYIVNSEEVSRDSFVQDRDVFESRVWWDKMNTYTFSRISDWIGESDLVSYNVAPELLSKAKWESKFLYMLPESSGQVKQEYQRLARELLGGR